MGDNTHLHSAVLGAIHAGTARATASGARVGAAARADHDKVLGRAKGAGRKAATGAARSLLRRAREGRLHSNTFFTSHSVPDH